MGSQKNKEKKLKLFADILQDTDKNKEIFNTPKTSDKATKKESRHRKEDDIDTLFDAVVDKTNVASEETIVLSNSGNTASRSADVPVVDEDMQRVMDAIRSKEKSKKKHKKKDRHE